jgi:hypothetical protein
VAGKPVRTFQNRRWSDCSRSTTKRPFYKRLDLRLGSGSAQLVSAGWLNTGYTVLRGGQALADVNRVGLCIDGWTVSDGASLSDMDLLFIGLIYHTILRRNAAAAGSSGAAT